MPRIIAVANQKGGVAKSTTAVHLAAVLGEMEKPTLVVDLDPQGSASRWLGDTREDPGSDLLDALMGDAEDGAGPSAGLGDLAVPGSAPGVDLVAASPGLAHAERDLLSVVAGALRLRELLGQLPERWETVILDCPPQLGQLTTSALAAAEDLVVPVETSAMALAGLAELLRTVRRASRVNPALGLAAIVACRVDYRNRLSREIVTTLSQRFPGVMCESVIRERVRLREAWAHRLPVTLYEPEGDAASDYRRLTAELVGRWEDGGEACV